jgi:hypothetical protein
MITGQPKFDTLAVYTLEASLVGPTISLKCKLGFVNSKDGLTHGWSTGEGAIWSKATMDALSALREAMERDLAALHMHGMSDVGGAVVTTGPGLRGLGEHVVGDGGDRTPQL